MTVQNFDAVTAELIAVYDAADTEHKNRMILGLDNLQKILFKLDDNDESDVDVADLPPRTQALGHALGNFFAHCWLQFSVDPCDVDDDLILPPECGDDPTFPTNYEE